MAEQEKKVVKISTPEGAKTLAEALQSLRGQPLPTDFDEWETPLRADIVEKLHQKLEKHSEN